MADQRKITLYQGHASPNNIILRPLPVADAAAGTTIYLYVGHATQKNIILRDPRTRDGAVAVVDTPNAARPFGWAVIRSWVIPDQTDYQRKIRVTESGAPPAVGDQPFPLQHIIEIRSWDVAATAQQRRLHIVQDGSGQQPPGLRPRLLTEVSWWWLGQDAAQLGPRRLIPPAPVPFTPIKLSIHRAWDLSWQPQVRPFAPIVDQSVPASPFRWDLRRAWDLDLGADRQPRSLIIQPGNDTPGAPTPLSHHVEILLWGQQGMWSPGPRRLLVPAALNEFVPPRRRQPEEIILSSWNEALRLPAQPRVLRVFKTPSTATFIITLDGITLDVSVTTVSRGSKRLLSPLWHTRFVTTGAALRDESFGFLSQFVDAFNGVELSSGFITISFSDLKFTVGTGSPEGALVGSPPDLYLNRSGGAGTTLYMKETGQGADTGWVAI